MSIFLIPGHHRSHHLGPSYHPNKYYLYVNWTFVTKFAEFWTTTPNDFYSRKCVRTLSRKWEPICQKLFNCLYHINGTFLPAFMWSHLATFGIRVTLEKESILTRLIIFILVMLVCFKKRKYVIHRGQILNRTFCQDLNTWDLNACFSIIRLHNENRSALVNILDEVRRITAEFATRTIKR